MNQGQLIGFSIIGSVAIAMIFFVYVVTVIAAVFSCVLLISVIQAKYPIVYQRDIFSTFIYSVAPEFILLVLCEVEVHCETDVTTINLCVFSKL